MRYEAQQKNALEPTIPAAEELPTPVPTEPVDVSTPSPKELFGSTSENVATGSPTALPSSDTETEHSPLSVDEPEQAPLPELDAPATTPPSTIDEETQESGDPFMELLKGPAVADADQRTNAFPDTSATEVKQDDKPQDNNVAAVELAAWQLGSNWSMAAALQAKDNDDARSEQITKLLTEAMQAAAELNVSLPPLPVHLPETQRLPENLLYMLTDAGPDLISSLYVQHGSRASSLAELAIKTHVLLLTYNPNSPRLEPIVVAIHRAAVDSGLPDNVWQELVELLDKGAEFNTVKAAIFRLHRAAETELTSRTGN